MIIQWDSQRLAKICRSIMSHLPFQCTCAFCSSVIPCLSCASAPDRDHVESTLYLVQETSLFISVSPGSGASVTLDLPQSNRRMSSVEAVTTAVFQVASHEAPIEMLKARIDEMRDHLDRSGPRSKWTERRARM